MPETRLNEKIKQIKKEAMFSILILILSLFFVFTWIGSISMSVSNLGAAPSMARDAYDEVGKAAQVPEAQTPSFVFLIGIIITVIFFLVLAMALSYQKKAPK